MQSLATRMHRASISFASKIASLQARASNVTSFLQPDSPYVALCPTRTLMYMKGLPTTLMLSKVSHAPPKIYTTPSPQKLRHHHRSLFWGSPLKPRWYHSSSLAKEIVSSLQTCVNQTSWIPFLYFDCCHNYKFKFFYKYLDKFVAPAPPDTHTIYSYQFCIIFVKPIFLFFLCFSRTAKSSLGCAWWLCQRVDFHIMVRLKHGAFGGCMLTKQKAMKESPFLLCAILLERGEREKASFPRPTARWTRGSLPFNQPFFRQRVYINITEIPITPSLCNNALP
jgi:hypothetical protein